MKKQSGNAALHLSSGVPLVLMVAVLSTLSACGGSNNSSAPVAPAAPVAPVVVPLANQLYTQSNETANTIVHFSRSATTGAITLVDHTATGGAGLNGIKVGGTTAGPDSLGSQYSVIVTPDKTTLVAVNAGDNSISTFAINQVTGSLTLNKNTPTSGLTPNSLAFSSGYLYVTFQGGTNQVGAYKLNADGSLSQIGLYNLGVPGAAPTQMVISPNGSFVVVSAGAGASVNAIVSLPINSDGSLDTPTINTVATPFAGAFVQTTSDWVYFATNIGAKGLGSYAFSTFGSLTSIASGTSGIGAPCWLSITPSNQLAYVGNGTGIISSYAITSAGAVSLLNANAATEPSVITGVSSVAADSWVSADGKYLYEDYLGDDKVVSYSISSTGVLTKINEQVLGTPTGLSMQGLAGI